MAKQRIKYIKTTTKKYRKSKVKRCPVCGKFKKWKDLIIQKKN